MTTLHITVGDREQLRADALQFVQTADSDDCEGPAIEQFTHRQDSELSEE